MLDSRLESFRTCLAGMILMAISGGVLGLGECPEPHTEATIHSVCARMEVTISFVVFAGFVWMIWRGRRPVCEGIYGLAAGAGALLGQLAAHLPTSAALCLDEVLLHVGKVFLAMFVGCVVGFAMPTMVEALRKRRGPEQGRVGPARYP